MSQDKKYICHFYRLRANYPFHKLSQRNSIYISFVRNFKDKLLVFLQFFQHCYGAVRDERSCMVTGTYTLLL